MKNHEIESILETQYTDRIDVNMEISLLEYGIIRNPTTNRVIFARPKNDQSIESDNYNDYLYDYTDYTTDDLLSDITDQDQGFFSYIGIDKRSYIRMIHEADNQITVFIQDLYSYSNPFDYLTFNEKLETII